MLDSSNYSEETVNSILIEIKGDNSYITIPKINEMLEEVSLYEITLVEDPTAPTLGTRYLQKILSTCRNYLNRTLFYLQAVQRHEKYLKSKAKEYELDLEFKSQEMLANDPIVRRQSAIDDRKALATAMLANEYKVLSVLKVELMDAEQSIKLLKLKYDHLRATSSDIKLQRAMIRDDKMFISEGGYMQPQANADGSVSGDLPPPVGKLINPSDLLDPNKRPDDLPEPVDGVHAEQIASFFNSKSDPEQSVSDDTVDNQPESFINYSDLID